MRGSGEGRGDGGFCGCWVFVLIWLASSRASPLPQRGAVGYRLSIPQMQQNPHLAGFVLLRIWWSRGDLNPRPPVLRCRYYMRSRVY